MRFRRRSRKKVLINITSLIDILFLLVIFFVVTSTFLEQSGMRLDLPSAESAESHAVSELVVEVDAAGGVELGGEAVSIGGLQALLAERVREADGPAVLVVRADRTAPHGRVVRVMDLARRAGVRDLVIATEPGVEVESGR